MSEAIRYEGGVVGISRFGDKWLSRFSGIYTFWPLASSGSVGVVTAYLASGFAWINQFGAFGWWSAGLVGFAITSFTIMLAGVAYESFATAQITRDWGAKVSSVNPMRQKFDNERMSLRELMHPIDRKVLGKTFTDCELIGHENIVFCGTTSIQGTGFIDCEFVIARDDAKVLTVKRIDDCTLVRGKFYNCTIFVNQEMWETGFKDLPGATCITYERG